MSTPPSSSSVNVRSEPGWVTHAVWWHVYPLGFTGSPLTAPPQTPVVEHRLAQLGAWLDYAVKLGASGLMLGPVFESRSHGYDTIDYFRVDPRLGDDADLDALFAAAHERGLRVVLDGVFNHLGRDHPLFQKVLSGNASEEERRWFRPAGDGFEVFEGHAGLVVLNHDEPAVADFVIDVMKHWLSRGADGWRLDAAYAVSPAFWARVLPAVRSAHPEAYLFGEVIHGDYTQIVADGQLDAVTQYEVWKALWSAINDRNFFELAWALERHNGYLNSFVPLTFAGNHDVTRIASKIESPLHLAHAIVVLLTIGGTPCVYYGDEQAFRGVKEDRAGGDDAIRPQFPAAGPEALSPLGWPTYRLHQELIGLRRRYPWLHRAQVSQLELTNTCFAYQVSGAEAAAGQRLCVALNLDDAVASVTVPGWVSSVLASSEPPEPPESTSGGSRQLLLNCPATDCCSRPTAGQSSGSRAPSRAVPRTVWPLPGLASRSRAHAAAGDNGRGHRA